MSTFVRLFLIALVIAACDTGSTTPTVGPEGIVQNMEVTNLSGTSFPWTGAAAGRLKRWDVERVGLIPVKSDGNALIEEAMDRIESELGRTLFERSSLDGTPEGSVERGLIVREGTALGPNGVVNGSTCGHVSEAPGTTAYPQSFYGSEGSISTVLYVHLSSDGCAASLDVAIHELGHALGLGAHFEGFGIGPAIDDNFWNVLHNLYRNEVGSRSGELDIEVLRR